MLLYLNRCNNSNYISLNCYCIFHICVFKVFHENKEKTWLYANLTIFILFIGDELKHLLALLRLRQFDP